MSLTWVGLTLICMLHHHLASCFAHSALLSSAQAELGRQWNSQNQSHLMDHPVQLLARLEALEFSCSSQREKFESTEATTTPPMRDLLSGGELSLDHDFGEEGLGEREIERERDREREREI